MSTVTRRAIPALAVAVVTLTAISGVALASGWRVVSQHSASGQFAAVAASATVRHPHEIAVRFNGGSGFVAWACDKGYSIGSWSHNYGRGFHVLGHVYGKNSCDVTASVGGSRAGSASKSSRSARQFNHIAVHLRGRSCQPAALRSSR